VGVWYNQLDDLTVGKTDADWWKIKCFAAVKLLWLYRGNLCSTALIDCRTSSHISITERLLKLCTLSSLEDLNWESFPLENSYCQLKSFQNFLSFLNQISQGGIE